MKIMKKDHYKKGFTLPEVMVSVAVLALVVVAATHLLVSIIRSNVENVNRLIAYGLAQEALEAVRNIRDSNWLLGANFAGELGKFGSSTAAVWEEVLPTDGKEAKYFVVDLKTLDTSLSVGINQVSLVSSVAPWRLDDITTAGFAEKDYAASAKTLLYKQQQMFQNVGEVHYGHHGADATLFHRYIRVEAVPQSFQSGSLPEDFSKMRVMSAVSWTEFGRFKEVSLNTELTNWKEGV